MGEISGRKENTHHYGEKNVALFYPPSLSEKTGVIARSETEKMEESVSEGISSPAVDTHTPDAPACKKKKEKDAVFHASLIGLMNLLTIAWKK